MLVEEELKEFLDETLETIAETKGYRIVEKKVMPDHIHLFIETDPFDSPMNTVVKVFKGISQQPETAEKVPEAERTNVERSTVVTLILRGNSRRTRLRGDY